MRYTVNSLVTTGKYVRVEVVMAQPLISSERGEVASVKDMCSEFPLESNCDLMMIMKVNYYISRETLRATRKSLLFNR